MPRLKTTLPIATIDDENMANTTHRQQRPPRIVSTYQMTGSAEDFMLTAKTRWFKVAELKYLLDPETTPLSITVQKPNKPPVSGTLLLYDRNCTPNYKRDGHDWVKRSNSTKVREDHVKLRDKGKVKISGFYAHSLTSNTLHRRSYTLIDTDKAADVLFSESLMISDPSLVLVHYFDKSQIDAENIEQSLNRRKHDDDKAHAVRFNDSSSTQPSSPDDEPISEPPSSIMKYKLKRKRPPTMGPDETPAKRMMIRDEYASPNTLIGNEAPSSITEAEETSTDTNTKGTVTRETFKTLSEQSANRNQGYSVLEQRLNVANMLPSASYPAQSMSASIMLGGMESLLLPIPQPTLLSEYLKILNARKMATEIILRKIAGEKRLPEA